MEWAHLVWPIGSPLRALLVKRLPALAAHLVEWIEEGMMIY